MNRYQVTVVDPKNARTWEQAILVAASEEDAREAMTTQLRPERKHWEVTWVEEVPISADRNGSTHGD